MRKGSKKSKTQVVRVVAPAWFLLQKVCVIQGPPDYFRALDLCHLFETHFFSQLSVPLAVTQFILGRFSPHKDFLSKEVCINLLRNWNPCSLWLRWQSRGKPDIRLASFKVVVCFYAKIKGVDEKVNKNKTIQARTAKTRDWTQTPAFRPGNLGHSPLRLSKTCQILIIMGEGEEAGIAFSVTLQAGNPHNGRSESTPHLPEKQETTEPWAAASWLTLRWSSIYEPKQ